MAHGNPICKLGRFAHFPEHAHMCKMFLSLNASLIWKKHLSCSQSSPASFGILPRCSYRLAESDPCPQAHNNPGKAEIPMYHIVFAGPAARGGLLQWGRPEGNLRRPAFEVPPSGNDAQVRTLKKYSPPHLHWMGNVWFVALSA